jgi:two-component sensor histidine kinase
MNIKKVYLLFIFLSVSSIYSLGNTPNDNNSKNNSNLSSGRLLLLSWDSINKVAASKIMEFNEQDWELKFEREYAIAMRKKDQELAFDLSIPLSFIYHSGTKFSKGIPFLQNLVKNKNKLNKDIYKSVLIKLEEEYRASNEMEAAIAIRKERILNNFVNNYWEIYKDCGLYEAAKIDLLQFVPIPNPNTYARLQYYFLLGELYMNMKSYDSAKLIYQKGLDETKKTLQYNVRSATLIEEKLKYWESCFIGYITKCNIEKGDYANAINNLKRDVGNSYNNPDNKIVKMMSLSRCYIHKNEFNNAKKYLDSANDLFVGKMSKTLKLELLLNYATYFNTINNNDSSLFYYKKYNEYKDTLYDRIQKNQSILLLVQLEVGNRRSELLKSNQSLNDSNKKNNQQKNALLILIFFLVISITISAAIYLNNVAKTKSKIQIEAQNKMINAHSDKMEAQFIHNETLLKELHHRVKNNLQVMYSLLNLQKRRNKDNEIIETLSSIQNRIQTMALVHQNLYNSGDFELVQILSYIKTLAAHLESIYKIDKQQIEVKFDIDENLKLPIETVVAIGLIINEAVSNSFKYAFKNNENKGVLKIQITCINNDIEVIVSDNGEGVQQKNKKENSLGLKLIDLMCLQLKATHIIETTNGVSHHIKFNKIN